MQELTERQLHILNLCVGHFIETAEPVSSRTLVKRFQLPYSPATIRNEMADLEEMGYLMQPHTSAGRVPTDKGYQVYVAGLRDVGVSDEDRLRLEGLELECLESCKEAGELLRDAVSILSVVTSLVGVAALPSPSHSTFTKLQLTAVERQLLVVLVTDACHAEAHLVPMEHPVPQDRLDICSRLINDNFSGKPLPAFLDGFVQVVQILESTYRVYVQNALKAFLEKVGSANQNDVLVYGSSAVLAQPEFQDFTRARAILDALEKKELLGRILTGMEARGPQITFVGVAPDQPGTALREVSLVSSVYRVRGATKGAIGILGPRRMDYRRIISYVNHISETLSRVFSEK